MPVFPHFRVVGVIGVDVAIEEKKPEPVFSAEEGPVEDQNDTASLLS